MTYQIEITRPYEAIPEIIESAATGTELATIAYKTYRNIRAEIIRNNNPRTRQEWKECQSMCSWLTVTFGPKIEDKKCADTLQSE